jgi:phytol kinase
MSSALLGISGVAAILGLALFGVRAAQRRLGWQPESARKSVHVVMGLTCLTFPWIFHSIWPVWALAIIAATALSSIRTVPKLREWFGQVLGGVGRDSWGELLFPFSVAFVFTLSRGNALFYCVPVLIMTLADALAALIGQRYGMSRYQTDDGWKSVEGSAAFFVVAFLATHIPLLLATDIGREESLVIATVMGLILMLMEAVSWRGLDNIFVPVVTYVCLTRLVKFPLTDLLWRIAVLVAFVVVMAVWRRAMRLTPTAAIAAGLVLYVSWAVGDWNWLIAPLATAAAYCLLCRCLPSGERQHAVQSIAAIGGVGICWLALSQIIETVNTIYAYGVAYGAHLGIITLANLAKKERRCPLPLAMAGAALIGFLAIGIPYALIWRHNSHLLPLATFAALLVSVAVALFAAAQPSLRNCPVDSSRWMLQALIALAVSTAAFGIISKLEPWSKSFQ